MLVSRLKHCSSKADSDYLQPSFTSMHGINYQQISSSIEESIEESMAVRDLQDVWCSKPKGS